MPKHSRLFSMAAALFAAASFTAATPSLRAAVYNYTFTIDDVAPGSSETSPLTFDGAAITSVADGVPGTNAGSFSSILTGEDSSRYSQLYIHLPRLAGWTGPETLTMGDLVGFTYYTRQTVAESPLNWAIRIYTAPQAGSHWYHERFEGLNPNSGDTGWHLSDANAPGAFIRVNLGGPNGGTTTSINSTLQELSGEYSTDDILYFSMNVGSSGNASAIASHLGGLSFTLANGDVYNIALIPEPGTLALLGVAGAGLFTLGRKRRRAF